MTRRAKFLVVGAAVVALGTTSILVRRSRNRGVPVRTEVLQRRDLVSLVTASGNIRARRTVDISSDVSARVAELLVDEGDDVRRGETLLRLEPDQYRAAVARTEASLAQAEAQRLQQEASLGRARRDLERALALRDRDSLLVSRQQVEDARTNLEVAEATLSSAAHGVSQARAALDEARDLLGKTIFTAPIDGKVTRLNVDEGETVITGTMNNPGSLILTISDLSVIEAVVQVDETSVPSISLDDSATVRIDAFPDREFSGRVSRIGNSAINAPSQQTSQQQASGQQAAIDFEIVLTLDPTDAPLRPDLSATADIVVDTRQGALGVPIIAMTVRQEVGTEPPSGSGSANVRPQRPEDIEGVFLVSGGRATFAPVSVGIAGQEYFEVLSGLSDGDTVVAGPYQRIRQLQSGDAIRVSDGDDG